MSESWMPALRVVEAEGRCRLWLGCYAFGEGESLQEAADDLVERLLGIAESFRAGPRIPPGLRPPDLRWIEFVYELSEIAALGGDVREYVLGPERKAA